LPTAVSPVLVGTGAAIGAGAVQPVRALLALVVAVALVIGVNYANDYSDGIRGTDDERVGPVRLVGSRLAAPAAVRNAAFLCFSVAALAGLTLVSLTQQWWLVAVGAGCIAGAWFYTGGRRPYGYAGLGEVAVFVFFGPVAVLMEVDGLEHALRVANDTIYGLAASVWTRDLRSAHEAVRGLEAGVIYVNCYDHGDPTQPFLGHKQSGQGGDKCLEGLLSYTQTKSAWIHLGR